MVHRRHVLKSGIALGASGLAGVAALAGSGSAQSAEPLIVNDFDAARFPGENALGERATVYGFEESEVTAAGLRLAYDDRGFLASRVSRDVSDYDTLQLLVSGRSGGEESDVQIEIGGVEGLLADLTDDEIGRSYSVVSIDLASMGVDRSSVDDVRLNFWQGGSGTVEIRTIGFGDVTGTGTGTTPTPGTPTPSDPEKWPWEVEAGIEKEPEETIPVEEVTADTTLSELCPTFDDRSVHMYVPRAWTDFAPGSATDPGDVDITETPLSDAEKAGLYEVDLDAVQSGIRTGEVTLGEMGTQALDHVTTYLEAGLPYHATAKLLPRIALLPDEPEPLSIHEAGNREEAWDETAGPQAATNDPDRLVQREWPTDAVTYQPDEKYERDRAHDQIKHEADDLWTEKSFLDDDVLRADEHPLLETIESGEHPVTGEDISGGFTSNAPMEAQARVHEVSGGQWYQILQFRNTSEIPYYVDAAVAWWVGPSGLADLRNGHYDNAQRPGPGLGHPQRDIIEVVYDEERSLSAYAVRLCMHDEPYHMRTAFPNQYWSIEQGVPAEDPLGGGERFASSQERQALVDLMWETLHVAVETNLDRNRDLVDALELRNRVTN
ncbi:hypothetical protein [Halomicrobium salinisoli]|uniref:hypothetical protein n=1 Tax=Halomicrobium salinisoli TaxID=2878391 RepID=UPI001CEFC001|nr:hypothetical protein [Halomicrobium salinisoli]